ncbi:tetratricopeptide repeat protein [Micromonospora sp. CPCC 205371]|nr:tetratricopeptide repeat protein [Micromonospora sp. CPCC 205371]
MSASREPAPRWHGACAAAVVIGSLSGGIATDLIADAVGSNLGTVTWLVAGGLAAVAAIVLLALEFRKRRATEWEEPPPPVPRQRAGVPTDLPYTYGFAGRDADVEWVREALEAEHAVALVGRRGVGTSACAVQAANTVRDRFPDGQMYLDLRAYGRPMRPRQVLAAVARKLGARPPRSPRAADLAATGAELRTRLAERKVLLVLDNVADPLQVRHLLPPAPQARLLMAGAPGLSTLDGVAVRWLGEPDRTDAVKLLADARTAAGRRTAPSEPSTSDLVELCGRQPHAIRALGQQIGRRGWRAEEVLATLRHVVTAPAHQKVPHAEALPLLAERDIAYRALSGPARRLFRLLSLAPGPLDRQAIAALRRHPDQALEELANGGFVTAAEGGRYEVRPLLSGYARLHLRHDEPARRRIWAYARLMRHLARQAERQDQDWLVLHHDLLRALVTSSPDGPATFADPLPRRVRRWWFRLAVALCAWYASENRTDEWEQVCQAALGTRLGGDRSVVAGWAHNELGVIRRRRGDPHGAAAVLTLAVTERGRRGQAQARTNLALALLDQGEVDTAIEHLHRARQHRSPGDRAGQALTHLGLGAAYLARGEPSKARHHLVQAANAFEAAGDRRGYAAALTNLVLAQWRLGEHLDAAHAWAAALEVYETIDDPAGRAAALLNAGAAMVNTDPPRGEPARELLTEALRLRAHRRPDAALGRTLLHLGDAELAMDHPTRARDRWQDAAGVCEEVGDEEGAAEANHRLTD